MKGSPVFGDWIGHKASWNTLQLEGGPAAFIRAIDALVTWVERDRERRQLVALSDELLHDIGLSRFDVEREARKWFWQR